MATYDRKYPAWSRVRASDIESAAFGSAWDTAEKDIRNGFVRKVFGEDVILLFDGDLERAGQLWDRCVVCLCEKPGYVVQGVASLMLFIGFMDCWRRTLVLALECRVWPSSTSWGRNTVAGWRCSMDNDTTCHGFVGLADLPTAGCSSGQWLKGTVWGRLAS